MAASFPTSIPALTNPTASDQLSSATVPHATQHANANDEIEALATKVGTGASTPTTVGDVLTVTGAGATAYQAGARILDRLSATTTVTSSTGETDLYSSSRTGELGTTRAYRLTVWGDYLNNTGGAVSATFRAKFGGTTIGSVAISWAASASRRMWCMTVYVKATGATNTQIGYLEYQMGEPGSAATGGSSTSVVNGGTSRVGHTGLAIDTTAAALLALTVQHPGGTSNEATRVFGAVLELL